mgnify:FL=1
MWRVLARVKYLTQHLRTCVKVSKRDTRSYSQLASLQELLDENALLRNRIRELEADRGAADEDSANVPLSASATDGAQNPFEQVRVLDMSRVLAGPFCTMHLGDLGAEVIKIEHVDEGDETRSWGPPFLSGLSAHTCLLFGVVDH